MTTIEHRAAFNAAPSVASPLHERLRRETASAHAAVEAALDLLDGELTVDRYRRLLGVLYGYYAPLEERLARLTPEHPRLGLSLRARAPLQRRDLAALGVSADQLGSLPRCFDLPPLARRAHLAGCTYVLEGACLGGQVIARTVERRLGITRTTGASFFVGDGAATAARWAQVLAWLGGLVEDGVDDGDVVAGAHDTFTTLARWARLRRLQESPGEAR